jgi:hypothetical protein
MSERVVLKAVIPVVNYGNISPEVEVEAPSYEEALAIAEGRIRELWTKYYNKPPNDSGSRRLQAFVGGAINYDEAAHTYTNDKGEVYQSGSQYAESFKKPFDARAIAKKMAAKAGVEPEDIIAMWKLKGEASKNLGTAIHAALQLEEQYRALGVKLGKSGAHEHPLLKSAVDGFISAHTGETAFNEVLVVDHKAKRAGQIDRLLIVKPNVCRIQDFKTSATIKDIETYWKQLSFYKSILEAADWIVEGLDIFHYNGKWEEYHENT